MKVLVLGKGGREHALSWKIAQSSLVEQVYCAPGNDGMAYDKKIQCADVNPSNFENIENFIKNQGVDLVVVGPEDLLAKGVVDALQDKVAIFGPGQAASQLESSKAFSKILMQENTIPTAAFEDFTDPEKANAFIDGVNWPDGLVVKCDVLAAGKGVIVCKTKEEAKQAVDKFLIQDSLGVNNQKIVIEECLIGREVSFFALCSGEDSMPLGYACDYKALRDGGKGPNTGGMGTYSPASWLSEADKEMIEKEIVPNTLKGMQKLGIPFTGILFVGVMVTKEGPKVLEYNVRFGDPETQILMPMIESDIAPYFLKAAQGKLSELQPIQMKSAFGVHLVQAAYGYPGTEGIAVRKSDVIQWDQDFFQGLEQKGEGKLFFAGVKKNGETLTTDGGRVLGLSVLSESLESAREKAYQYSEQVSFADAQMRGDIGLHD
jgi:phosphoribosylamine--glycine ligase